MRVDIIQFPQTAVAALTHQGLPERINDTAARFIQWRKATGGSPVATSRTYGLAPDDPATTEGAAFRFTLCGSVEAPVAEDNEWGVKNALIPAGRCAVVRHHGSHDLLADCARALYRDWLPASGYRHAGTPPYEYVPVGGSFDPATGILRCEIRVPVAG